MIDVFFMAFLVGAAVGGIELAAGNNTPTTRQGLGAAAGLLALLGCIKALEDGPAAAALLAAVGAVFFLCVGILYAFFRRAAYKLKQVTT